MEWHWGWSAFLIALLLVAVAVLGSLPLRDGDLWWQMAYGRQMLLDATLIPDQTGYTWSQTDGAFIYCAWFPQVLLYLMYTAGGLPVLYGFRYLCFLTFLGFIFVYARNQKIEKNPITWLITMLGFLMAYDSAGVIKPVIFSFIYMTIVVGLWIRVKTRDSMSLREIFMFPLVTFLWVNSHGTIIFGIFFMLLMWFGESLNYFYAQRQALSLGVLRRLFLSLMLSAAAIFISPYGWRYPHQLLSEDILGLDWNEMNTVADYRSIFSQIGIERNYVLFLVIAALLLLVLILRSFRGRGVDWAILLLNLGFAVLYAQLLRVTYFWAPIFIFSSLYLLTRPTSFSWARGRVFSVACAIGSVIACVSFFGAEVYVRETKKKINSWLGFGVNYLNPIESGEYLAANLAGKKIGNDYVTGGYLLWRLYPETKIMIDPRYFPFMAWYAQYNQAFWGSEDKLSAFVDSVKCDAWCISLRFTKVLEWFRKRPEWKLLNYGPCAATFARKDLPVEASSPMGNAGIADIVVPGYAVVVLNFATNNSDLEGAVRIVKGMRRNFGTSKQVLGASDYMNGFFAYFLRDYGAAVNLLASARESRIIWSDTILVNSYQLGAAVHWNQQRHKEAFDVIEASLEVKPNNLISVFNAGVIGWYLESSGFRVQGSGAGGLDDASKIENENDDSGSTESQVGWKEHLEKFVKNVKGTNKYPKRTVRIAEAILQGNYTERPPLMVPPEPDTGQKKRILRLQAELNTI